jgi:hypothetical protein
MIEFLPESQRNLLIARMSARLTVQDYEEILIPKLDAIIADYGKICAAVVVDETFTGWESGALWDDIKYGLQHRKDLEKAVHLGGLLVCGEIQTFNTDKLTSALEWIKAK